MAGSALVVLLGLAIVMAAFAYCRDMRRAYRRISGHSVIVESPFGAVEYLSGGSGTPVLVVHGSGGGYDQGELIAQALLGNEFFWIAPSRFGYLRSARPAGAGFEDQAHALAWLLDHLGVTHAAVLALSHGGPSALFLAAMHPERVASLTLISGGVASVFDARQARANRRGDALVAIFRFDVSYWAISRFCKRPLLALMGAPPGVLKTLSAASRELARRVIDGMNPVSPRRAGVALDHRAALPNARISAIRAPTLIFHSRDDGLQGYHNAEFAVATIPGARLVSFDHGGHMLLAVELEAMRTQVQAFIREAGNARPAGDGTGRP